MTIQRQVRKEKEMKKVYQSVAAATTAHTDEEKLSKVLTGIPREAVTTLLLLCRLAYCRIFDWNSEDANKKHFLYERIKWMHPRIILLWKI